MNKPITHFILLLCFYFSLIRASNVGLFYPTSEMLLGSIDYTLPKILNLFLLAGFTAYIFLLNDYSFIRKALKDFMILALGLCAIASLTISVNKTESVKYIAAIIVMSFPAIVYIEKYGTENYLKALGYFFIAMAFANLLYLVAMPQYAIMSGNHAGKWRGLFEHKNTAAPFFAIGFYVILDQIRKRNIRPMIVPAISLLICLLFIAMAQSATGIVAFIAMGFLYIGFHFIYRLGNPAERIMVLILSLSLGAAVLFLAGPYILQLVFDLTGKDATLTGRTNIWAPLIEMSLKKPIFGYGFGMAERSEFILLFNDEIGFGARTTHNAFLDLIIGMGYPATILFICIIIRTLFQSISSPVKRLTCLRSNALASGILLTMVIVAFSTGGVFLSRSFFWQFTLAAFLILYRYKRLNDKA